MPKPNSNNRQGGNQSSGQKSIKSVIINLDEMLISKSVNRPRCFCLLKIFVKTGNKTYNEIIRPMNQEVGKNNEFYFTAVKTLTAKISRKNVWTSILPFQ